MVVPFLVNVQNLGGRGVAHIFAGRVHNAGSLFVIIVSEICFRSAIQSVFEGLLRLREARKVGKESERQHCGKDPTTRTCLEGPKNSLPLCHLG